MSAGASGAIFGVYGALAAYLLSQPGVFPRGVVRPMLNSTLMFIGVNVFLGMTQKGISNAAHLGGLAGGFVLGLILARPLEMGRRKAQTIPRLALGIVAGAAVLAGAFVTLPKVSAAEREYMNVIRRWETDGDVLINRYNAMVGEKLEDDVWAARLEKEVLPGWEDLYQSMARIQLPPGSRAAGGRNVILEYFRFRRDAHRLMIKALKDEDPPAFEESQKLMKRAESLLPLINEVRKKSPF